MFNIAIYMDNFRRDSCLFDVFNAKRPIQIVMLLFGKLSGTPKRGNKNEANVCLDCVK